MFESSIAHCFTLQGFADLPHVLRANRKAAALRSARNTLFNQIQQPIMQERRPR